MSTLFQSVPGLAGTTLDTADSDTETLDEYSSGVIRSASKDQVRWFASSGYSSVYTFMLKIFSWSCTLRRRGSAISIMIPTDCGGLGADVCVDDEAGC